MENIRRDEHLDTTQEEDFLFFIFGFLQLELKKIVHKTHNFCEI